MNRYSTFLFQQEGTIRTELLFSTIGVETQSDKHYLRKTIYELQLTSNISKMEHMEKKDLIELLNELAAKGELVVFNPETSELLSHEYIHTVCLNGDAVQISLSESILERRAESQ